MHKEYHQDASLRPHPIMSLYGRTSAGSFPLILVVGREPNDNLHMGNEVGPYEFPGKGENSVPFWDLAYSLIADSIDKRGMELKKLCKERDSSVIAFADISSRPIPSREPDKEETRKKFITDDYICHMRKVASKPIFQRVKLVIFAGLTYPPWAKARYGEALKRIELEWEKESVEVRFLCGRNMREIKTAFFGKRLAAKWILEDWLKQ